ncbi:hypothetical protein [Paenibacillus phytorum]|uniref:hypothetical protein n=1 Tax=Paenibacillus phytorum TaxID=2654977 RepID=UPI001492C1FF|nr:hypothetical protein [Paenibacillus phytorum]
MQSKLATWSTESKERKFDRFLRIIATLFPVAASTHPIARLNDVQINDRRP